MTARARSGSARPPMAADACARHRRTPRHPRGPGADFTRELSVIAARGRDGAIAVYPLGENIHAGGVLQDHPRPRRRRREDRRRAPAPSPRPILERPRLCRRARRRAVRPRRRAACWSTRSRPRVHNTGHWTQDGCVCDQFEQHIRAIAGWPLGPTTAHARVEMTNLLGDEVEQWPTLSAEPDARLHLYGKAEARPGRKMGHVNRVSRSDQDSVRAKRLVRSSVTASSGAHAAPCTTAIRRPDAQPWPSSPRTASGSAPR